VLNVREVSLKVLEEIRGGSGPQLLEFTTYRFKGHSMGDPERYRKAEEVRQWEESDPIGIYRKRLVNQGTVADKDLDELDQMIEKELQAAVDYAEASPEPGPEDLFKHIYVEGEE